MVMLTLTAWELMLGKRQTSDLSPIIKCPVFVELLPPVSRPWS